MSHIDVKTIVNNNKIARPQLQRETMEPGATSFCFVFDFYFPRRSNAANFHPKFFSSAPSLRLFSLTADDDRVATPVSFESLPNVLLAQGKSIRSISTRSPSRDEDRKAKASSIAQKSYIARRHRAHKRS